MSTTEIDTMRPTDAEVMDYVNAYIQQSMQDYNIEPELTYERLTTTQRLQILTLAIRNCTYGVEAIQKTWIALLYKAYVEIGDIKEFYLFCNEAVPEPMLGRLFKPADTPDGFYPTAPMHSMVNMFMAAQLELTDPDKILGVIARNYDTTGGHGITFRGIAIGSAMKSLVSKVLKGEIKDDETIRDLADQLLELDGGAREKSRDEFLRNLRQVKEEITGERGLITQVPMELISINKRNIRVEPFVLRNPKGDMFRKADGSPIRVTGYEIITITIPVTDDPGEVVIVGEAPLKKAISNAEQDRDVSMSWFYEDQYRKYSNGRL